MFVYHLITTCYLRIVILSIWTVRDTRLSFQSNGLVLMVADKKEVSDARDKLTVPRHTPLELFGEEGFEHVEVNHYVCFLTRYSGIMLYCLFQPFIPIETQLYTEDEADNMYKYYTDKKWISSKNGMFHIVHFCLTFELVSLF